MVLAQKTLLNDLAKSLKLPILTRFHEHVDPQHSFEENFIHIMQVEQQERQIRSIARRTKAAGFPLVKTLDHFDFARLSYLDKGSVYALTTGEFVANRHNVVAYGNSGMGKTHVSIAIGIEMIQKGYTVKFRKAADLVEELQEAKNSNQLTSCMKTWSKVDLLLLDELGYLFLDTQASSLLFQLLSSRYEVKSTFVTTNFEFSRWVDFLGDRAMAIALIDRFAHKTIFLNMNGDSYRLDSGIQASSTHSKKAARG